jgi:hypothetical protein
LRERGFELKGRLVAERRMEALLVVDLRDEAVDAVTGFSSRAMRSIRVRGTFRAAATA